MKHPNPSAKPSFYLLFLLLLVLNTYSAQVCEFNFSTCPENFDGDTIVLPQEVIGLSANIFTCKPSSVIEGIKGEGGPPSIMFVIDHSGSMMGSGRTYPGNDTWGARFNVTRDLIDTISKVHPDAEIGVVVFREVLYFDHRNNSLFTPLPRYGNQSYLPLTKLNEKVSSTQNGMEAIKAVLATDTVQIPRGSSIIECVDLFYKPFFETFGNTNINNAFTAALHAFQSAQNPKKRQFIIFLSDGEPYPPGEPDQHGGKDPFYFVEGQNTPTTFTVFFNNSTTKPPPSLTQMTNNIKSNGYSSSNSSSNIWVLQANYNALMSLLVNDIIRPYIAVTNGTPTRIVVNSRSSTTYRDSVFLMGSRTLLDPGLTKFDMTIHYHVTNEEEGTSLDTSTNASFYVKRVPGATPPDGVIIDCWDTNNPPDTNTTPPKKLPYIDKPKIANNPFNPGKTTVPPIVQKTYKQNGLPVLNEGVVIMMEPSSPPDDNSLITGTMSIYDVVKNPIIEDKQMAVDQITKRVFFVWDGYNEKGRMVSTGTYLGVIKLSDNKGMKEMKTVRIGVKR